MFVYKNPILLRLVDRNLLDAHLVQGRITEVDLPAAEKTFPGITVVYEQLPEKPQTFLQLVWVYEELMQEIALAEARGN